MRVSLIFSILLFATTQAVADDVYYSCRTMEFVELDGRKLTKPTKEDFMMAFNSKQVTFGEDGWLEGLSVPMQIYSDRDGYGPHWTANSSWYNIIASFISDGWKIGELNVSRTDILGVKAMTAMCKKF